MKFLVCHSTDCYYVQGGGLAERIYFSLITWAQNHQKFFKFFNNESELNWEKDNCYDNTFITEKKEDDSTNNDKTIENSFTQESENQIENIEEVFF